MQLENGLARTLIDACEFSLTMQALALAPHALVLLARARYLY